MITLALLLVGGFAHAEADVRAAVDRAAAAGLPTEILVDKVREGLAKGAAPARIALVVRALADGLERARSEAQAADVAAASPALLKAIVEAHAAGVGPSDVATLLRGGGDRERALEVLTDLAARGYPVDVAARAVSAIADRGDARLDHLVAAAERLRAIDAATPGDALDALARADAAGLGLERADPLLRRAGDVLDGDAHGPNRETSGARGPRSGGVAAPAHGKS